LVTGGLLNFEQKWSSSDYVLLYGETMYRGLSYCLYDI